VTDRRTALNTTWRPWARASLGEERTAAGQERAAAGRQAIGRDITDR
jgi:hypothetical protein